MKLNSPNLKPHHFRVTTPIKNVNQSPSTCSKWAICGLTSHTFPISYITVHKTHSKNIRFFSPHKKNRFSQKKKIISNLFVKILFLTIKMRSRFRCLIWEDVCYYSITRFCWNKGTLILNASSTRARFPAKGAWHNL